MEPRVADVLGQYRQLLNRECPTETIAVITRNLEEFYSTKESVTILTQILNMCEEEPLRHQAAIALKTCLVKNRESIAPHEAESLFQMLTSTVLKENNAPIRASLINSLSFLMNSAFTEPLLGTLHRELNGMNVRAVVNLLELICKDSQAAGNQDVMNFTLEILTRCFQSGNVELSCDAFQCIITARKAHFLESLEFCWAQLIGLFDACIGDRQNMQRLTSLFNELLEEEEQRFPPLRVGYYESLYEKVMGLFEQSVTDLEILLAVFSVVETLCEVMGTRVTHKMFVHVANIAFKLVVCCFNPADISMCQFFDSTMTNLMYSDLSDSRMPVLWELCQHVAQTDAGKFAAISALRATTQESNGFFDGKCDELVEFLSACLSNPLDVIKTTAVESLSDFAPIFTRRNVPGLNELARKVLVLIRHFPTEEWIAQLSSLLGSMHDTNEIFEELIVAFMEMIKNQYTQVSPKLLDCMTKLVDGATPPCIQKYTAALYTIIEPCLQATDDQEMAVSAMGLLESLLRIHYREMVPTGKELYPFLNAKMHSDDTGIVIAALSILQTVFESYPNSENIMWSEIDIPLLIEMAGKDISAEFRDAIQGVAPPQPEGTVIFRQRFSCAEHAIRILALAVKMNEALFREYAQTVMHMCFLQIQSVEDSCVVAGCKSLVDVAAAMRKYQHMTEEIAYQIVVDLCKIIFINRDREEKNTQHVNAVRTLLFDMHLNVGNIAGLLSECANCLFEGEPIIDLNLEDAHLLRDIMRKAAREDPAGTFQCGKDLYAKLSPTDQNWNIIYLLAGISLEIPQQTPLDVKQNVFSFIMQKVATDPTSFAGMYLLGCLAQNDTEFVTPFLAPIMRVLVEAANPRNQCQRARDNAVLALMKYLMRFTNESTETQFTEVLKLVLSSLPVDPHATDRDAITSQFLLWVSQKYTDPDCLAALVRVCVTWFLEGIDVTHLITIRGVISASLPRIQNAERLVATICNNDQKAMQNLMDLLNPT